MSHIPGHVSLVSRVDRVLSKENLDADRACADQKIAAVICSNSCISHLWYATKRDRVHKNRYDESGIDTSSNSGSSGWASFKRNIIYAIRSLKINGVEINRSVCIHAQTARRCRTRRVHSSIHTAAPTRRVPFASTENTSRCGLSVPDEPDAVDAVCTRATRRVLFANGTRVGLNLQCEHGHRFVIKFWRPRARRGQHRFSYGSNR